ncbi:MAG: hypothetical protein FWG67_08530 [Defluviitaleaceae bacterium]|nr:hypothetical protein [Defluviitaleaceae bacterium]
MNQIKMKQWLKERDITCEESFADALYRLAVEHKRKHNCTLDEIWKELGISRQNVYYWRKHSNSMMTQVIKKHCVIEHTAELFGLTALETEQLANKAGLARLTEYFQDENNELFSKIFNEKLATWKGKQRILYEHVGMHKATFYRIKQGENLRKEVILALFITMDLSLSEIQQCLRAAGYCLSFSLPVDLLICYLLDHDLKEMSGFERLHIINDLLYELDQPLLETIQVKELP